MDTFTKFAISTGIFILIQYIIGILRTYKNEKRFLVPDKRYIMGIFKSSGYLLKAFSGVFPPIRVKAERSDGEYYTPTNDEFREALLVVHQMMIDGGWTLDDYVYRAKDCEDYAAKMAVELRNYIATTFPVKVVNKGVAIGMIGYTVEKSGKGHVVIKAYLEDGVKYYQPYPGEKYLTELVLTPGELDSIDMDIM